MIEYIAGKLDRLDPMQAVIDCSGVGYILEISLNTYEVLQSSSDNHVKLFAHEVIREDEHLLYGFFDESERAIFRLLIGVNGVGASTARMMLSSMSVDEIRTAIASQDVKTIQRVKGVGAKTAQRIVLELADKMPGSSAVLTLPGIAPVSRNKEEALSALVMLGFPKATADKVLQSLDASLSVEDLIKQALKRL